nr:amino acid--tRNA ligase-related protein [Campylobacter jejuni]
MFDNILEQQRIEKAKELKNLGINPYPHFLEKEMSLKTFKDKFSYILEQVEKRDESVNAVVAGRLKLLRIAGKSIFANIEDEDTNLQIYFSKDSVGEELYTILKKNLEVGDIVLVKGFPFVTKTGEFSLHASEVKLATKAIVPLPEKYHGLTDIEQRYRKRYVDMIMNVEVRKDFLVRSKVVSLIRHFFENKGFLEVETPMMHPIAGGANAKPFVTFHNSLGVERFLRIAPELYLKRLIVGGFEAVFEINRCFRNEGMDLTHNPEFTTIEFYWLKIGYFDQARSLVNSDKSLLEIFCPNGGDRVEVRGKNMHVYGYLKNFLFPKEFLDKSVALLSGGEKNRVALALLFAKEYDVLILDEPTNDLDIATINILEEYLLSFEGAILLVSHDRYFVDKIATKLYAFEGNGYINILHTLYTEYLENEKEIEELDNFALELQTQEQNNNQKEKSSKKLSYKENEILKNHPEKIDFLEQKIAKLNQDLSDPNVYQEIGINKLYQELEVMQKELEILENEYFLVLEKSENL